VGMLARKSVRASDDAELKPDDSLSPPRDVDFEEEHVETGGIEEQEELDDNFVDTSVFSPPPPCHRVGRWCGNAIGIITCAPCPVTQKVVLVLILMGLGVAIAYSMDSDALENVMGRVISSIDIGSGEPLW